MYQFHVITDRDLSSCRLKVSELRVGGRTREGGPDLISVPRDIDRDIVRFRL